MKTLAHSTILNVPAISIAGEKTIANAYDRSAQILQQHLSPNTKRAQEGDILYWRAWMTANSFDFDNGITVAHVITFIIQHAEGIPAPVDEDLVQKGIKKNLGTHKIGTIKRRIATLFTYCESNSIQNPTRHSDVRRLLNKIKKIHGTEKHKAKAITKSILLDMVATCDNSVIGIRDRAVLLFGWASGGRRRSEITAAEFKNLESQQEGYIYKISRSKTDKEGVGHFVPVNSAAAIALQEWLLASGIIDGKLFRSVSKSGKIGVGLSDIDVSRIVKNRIKKAGYEPSLFSAHSLRSGFVTEAGKRGCPIGDVMAMTGHKSLVTAQEYYQAGAIVTNSAAYLV